VAHYNKHSQPLERVTIIPRGMALGVTMQRPMNDRYIKTKPELDAELRVLMGGYAAEQLLTGVTSSGASNDLKRAAETAFQMVAHYGMSEKMGPIFIEHQTDHPFLGRKFATDSGTSDATLSDVEEEARKFIRAAEDHAKSAISTHMDAHQRLTDALMNDETVERERILELLGDPASHPRQVPAPFVPPMRSDSSNDKP
jgi:cell division protease FtsH